MYNHFSKYFPLVSIGLLNWFLEIRDKFHYLLIFVITCKLTSKVNQVSSFTAVNNLNLRVDRYEHVRTKKRHIHPHNHPQNPLSLVSVHLSKIS